MTDAEIDRIAEALRMAGPLPYYQCKNLIAEVRRLRKICADARPFADMALRSSLDFDPATTEVIKALRSALS
jgi:tRNA U34 5-methylaminomethyl-2-thiouridine-forming methyltransferase MnmC